MRVFAPRPSLAVWGITLASLGCLLAAGRPAAAQAGPGPEQAPLFTARVGGYFLSNSTIGHAIGSSFLCAGLDYAIQHEQQSRTIVSVDYIDRSSDSNTLRVFPVTIGQILLQGGDSDVQPYYGAGAGGYFMHQDFNRTDQANRTSHDNVVFGGYLEAGVEYHKYLALDARYHLVTSSNGINPSGLEVTLGFRF